MTVLQTDALPLGYAADKKSGKRDLNPRHSPWQGDALPLSYSRLVLLYYALLFCQVGRPYPYLPFFSQSTQRALRRRLVCWSVSLLVSCRKEKRRGDSVSRPKKRRSIERPYQIFKLYFSAAPSEDTKD